jgi:hypothetical protein
LLAVPLQLFESAISSFTSSVVEVLCTKTTVLTAHDGYSTDPSLELYTLILHAHRRLHCLGYDGQVVETWMYVLVLARARVKATWFEHSGVDMIGVLRRPSLTLFYQ